MGTATCENCFTNKNIEENLSRDFIYTPKTSYKNNNFSLNLQNNYSNLDNSSNNYCSSKIKKTRRRLRYIYIGVAFRTFARKYSTDSVRLYCRHRGRFYNYKNRLYYPRDYSSFFK